MSDFIEGEIGQILIPLLEPVVLGLAKSKYVQMYLEEKSQTLTLGEVRLAGINPEKILRINEPLSQVTMDFLNRDLPPGNNKSGVFLSPILTGKQEAEIRAFALQQYWEGPQPVFNPLQKLLNEASVAINDVKAMIVANGVRYNHNNPPTYLDSIYADTRSIDSLPIEKPDIIHNNSDYSTFFILPIKSESTKLPLFPGGFSRNPHVEPRMDWYVVKSPEANTEISHFIKETPTLQMYFLGLTLASNQEAYIQQLKSKIIKVFKII